MDQREMERESEGEEHRYERDTYLQASQPGWGWNLQHREVPLTGNQI